MSGAGELTVSRRFDAFGGTAIVAVTDPDGLERACEHVRETVRGFDAACSRFRPDSEITAVNAAAGEPVKVGPMLLEAVEAALRAARLTGGDVDPTVGGALIALGYDRDFDSLQGSSSVSIAAVPGWHTVAVDHEAGTIRAPRGVALALGATAKALAADRAAAAARDAVGCGVLVSFSGDIALAGEAPDGGWRVRVTDDHRSGVEAPGQWVTLRSGGLASSSTTVRRWQAGGDAMHHLLDPRSGRPAAVVWRTASVTASSCLDANIASTAAIVRGERAPEWLSSLEIPSRLVHFDGAVVHLAGWPAEGDDLPAREQPRCG